MQSFDFSLLQLYFQLYFNFFNSTANFFFSVNVIELTGAKKRKVDATKPVAGTKRKEKTAKKKEVPSEV